MPKERTRKGYQKVIVGAYAKTEYTKAAFLDFTSKEASSICKGPEWVLKGLGLAAESLPFTTKSSHQ